MFDRSQNSIFDVIRAEEEKQAGMYVAAENKASLLELARSIAVAIGRRQRFVTADDVQRELYEQHNISTHALGNAAGSIFKGNAWHDTGRRVASERVSAHGRELRVWTLAEEF